MAGQWGFTRTKRACSKPSRKRRRDQPGKSWMRWRCRRRNLSGAAGTGDHLDSGALPASQRTHREELRHSTGSAEKGLRIAKAKTLDQANRYLQEEFAAVVEPATESDPGQCHRSHRPLTAEHDLDAILSVIETRQVTKDYTIHFRGKHYQIARADVRHGLTRRHSSGPGAAGRLTAYPFSGAGPQDRVVPADGQGGVGPAAGGRRGSRKPPATIGDSAQAMNHLLQPRLVFRSGQLRTSIARGPRITGPIGRRHKERRAKAARRFSRFIAQGLRSSETSPKKGALTK